MYSLAEEGYDDRGTGIQQPAGGCPCTTMVDYRGDVLEEPLVRAVAKPKNVFGRWLIGTEFAPAPGDDGSRTNLPDRLDQGSCELDWVVDH